jgi:uncharacterized membrane protein
MSGGITHPMKSHFRFARIAYAAVAVLFWMAAAGNAMIAFERRGESALFAMALVLAIIGVVPFLRYRYWSRRAAEAENR